MTRSVSAEKINSDTFEIMGEPQRCNHFRTLIIEKNTYKMCDIFK